ncbi:preprotein translocase subunit SecE [Candidatus Shapirobacteria bacterium CG10_big_fil_rev_8_21_14_0_10_38_14]|uniref:Protein translocase subunit SecE n=1 Tax=Candidatus Shapirobacteria bacterium CG10_big_fil_rev_8_21_14_0_10_38_14 TaxID=1974483 RepID=A0A2M8L564_9BACT|nr:MAG: preprotein translocase subunit SecE [Candidatus Shapirobacteria bacterium CG10_big_fil_rev_8_21_14_0_10_38_14]
MQAKPLVFLKEVKAEMRKVDWPNRQTAIRLTAIVVGVSVVVAIFIGSLDFLFTKLMEIIIK